MKRRRLGFISVIFVSVACFGQANGPHPKTDAPHENDALVERVDNTAFIQLEATSFKDLTPQQKRLA